MGIDQVSPARKAVFLDRDGTLIDVVRDEEIGAITVAFHPSQIRFLPGVIEGLKVLRDAGYALGIATNQPAPAKGQFSAAAVERTNAALVEMLANEGIAIEKVAVCMHHTKRAPGGDDSLVMACDCRKPKPGLIHQLLASMGVAAEDAWMIGDSAGDVEAGRAAGVRTALVFPRSRCELCPLRQGPNVAACVHGDTFSDAVREVLDAEKHAIAGRGA